MTYWSSSMVKLINSYLTEADICEIARISTGKKKRSDETLVEYLVRQGHDSIFEHAVMTFYVEVPIYTARQWMRHRIGSYTEKSGRYSEMEEYDMDTELSNWKNVLDEAFKAYDEAIE